MTDEMRNEAIEMMKARGFPVPTSRKTLQEGCATTLRAALDPGLRTEAGVYLVDCQVVEPGLALREAALDPEGARRLWGISEEMVGEKFEY
jgi:hypothetical protein